MNDIFAWYLALHPVQAVAVCAVGALILLLLVFGVCALIVASDADAQHEAAEHARRVGRTVTRGKTHGCPR